MSRRGPLADSYAAAAALVIFALVPYLALSSAIPELQTTLQGSVGLSRQSLQLGSGMANAAYAFGTVLAVQLGIRLRPRRLLAVFAVLSVIGGVLTALAPTPGLFIAGHILQGLTTSLLLITAVPPLVTGWPARRMPITGGIMNLCIFGAVALGPVVGFFEASAHAWRLLFWLAAGSAGLALLFVALTWEDQPPQDPPGPIDLLSVLAAGGGAAAAFFGASELSTHAMLSPIVFIPLLGGVLALVWLVIHQITARDPLMPVNELLTTKPVAGVIAAMAAGAASVTAIDLVAQAIEQAAPPAHLASLFWPFFGAAVITAVLFGLVLRTRLLAPFVGCGLLLLAGGLAVLSGVTPTGSHTDVAFGVGMLGGGVGASVAPALFMAGYSLRSAYIQRVFALLELLRGVAAFLVGPILLHLALTVNGGRQGHGTATALWICFAIAATGAALGAYVFVIGRARFQRPDIETWEAGEEPAWDSPPLAAGLRRADGYRERVAELMG